MRRGAVTILLFLAAAGLALSVAALVAGGLAWPAAGILVRDPLRPFLAAVVLLGASRLLSTSAEFREQLAPFVGTPATRAPRVAAIAAACLLIYATAWSSRAAGGSDSSCYVLQAEAFARGHVTLANPVAAVLPGAPDAVFAPIGFIPSPREYGAAVPICAPGLAIAMVVPYLVHPSAVFLVVPLAAALLVWLTFLYGRRVGDEMTGALGAALLACSPIVLYQAVQPMSDVPAAAALMAAMVAGSPVGAGVWGSIAVLMRPNLALLLPLLLLQERWLPSLSAKTGAHLFRVGLRFAAGAAPGLAIMLALNASRYGAPLATGYGSTDVLFTRAHVYANLLRYPRWILETHTPFVLLALAAPWTLRHDPARARVAWLSLAAVTLLTVTYFAYTVFDDWWYIRFLLPALPIVLVLSVSVLRSLLRGLPWPRERFVAIVICAALALYYVSIARQRHAMDLQALESRFALAGRFAATLPSNAVVLAVQQSGSIRFHGRRDTIAWDAIPEDGLDAAIERLRSAGRAPYFALEDEEEPRFRLRFASERAGALEAPPIATIRAPVRVRFYAALPAARRAELDRVGRDSYTH